MYAIIATGGKQYKVEEGDVIKVEKVGTPTVAGASVTATVVAEGKAKKVIVYRYKRKTGYHKKNGHRQPFTQVKIDKISC